MGTGRSGGAGGRGSPVPRAVPAVPGLSSACCGSLLAASCSVTRQEEWEQVVLGLPGPGRAEGAGQAGSVRTPRALPHRDPHPSPALLGTPSPGSAAQPWGEDGGSRMRPPPVRCGRAEQFCGVLLLSRAGKSRLGSGRVTFGSDLESWPEWEQHKAPKKHP